MIGGTKKKKKKKSSNLLQYNISQNPRLTYMYEIELKILKAEFMNVDRASASFPFPIQN